ncbi:chaperone modulator CbpM [Mycobacterium kyogaense]|uniref:chaperone modulator CbpM n=1 Tax=Mycobacterium kyogaense TaxID=2212479 RepID=UPI000DADD877|nr:chaperone modulator CbpM [Mycobacterium kyogaense]
MTAPRYALVRRPGLSLDEMARRCGVHPDMLRRLAALGLLPCTPDVGGEPRFDPSGVAAVARIHRLRAGLGLNYAAIGLVLELLDRIDELESASRRGRTFVWTSTD